MSGHSNLGPQGTLSCMFSTLSCFKSHASNDCHHYQAAEEFNDELNLVFEQSSAEKMKVSVLWFEN